MSDFGKLEWNHKKWQGLKVDYMPQYSITDKH